MLFHCAQSLSLERFKKRTLPSSSYPVSICEIKALRHRETSVPETGRMPPGLIRRRKGWKMWEALAAMTLICVLVLVTYQVIEKKFRERHV